MSATTIDVYVTSPPVVDVTIVSDPVFEVLGVLPTGPRGEKGDQGDPGADSTVPGPPGDDGADGREVELQKSATHVQWRYVGDPSWTDLVALSDITGAAGADGSDGTDGSDGADGTDGKTILSGSGAPAGGTGVDGDFYIRTSDWTIYGPKTAGAWGSPTSLVGPAGADGADGTDGADGAPGADGADAWPLTADVDGAGFSVTNVVLPDYATADEPIAQAHIADTSAAHAASAVAFTPTGLIVATDVQAALQELDSEKAALAGASWTGASPISIDTVTAAQLITLPNGTVNGLVVKTVAAQAGYGEGQAIAVFGPGTDATDQSSAGSLMFRVDPDGNVGTVGCMHVAIGARGRFGVTPTYGLQLQGYQTAPNLLELAPMTGHTGHAIHGYEKGTGSTRWYVDPDFIVTGLADDFTNAAYYLAPQSAGFGSVRLFLAAINAATIPLYVKAAASQTADLARWMASNGTTILSRVNKGGYLISRLTAAPADADLSTNDLTFWLDNTSGAPTVRAKMKDSGGTVANQTLLASAQIGAATSTLIESSKVSGDTTNRFQRYADGKEEWGPGGSTAVDTNLYRGAAGEVKTDGAFVAAASGAGAKIGAVGPSFKAALVFGASGDTNLYRDAADALKSDDAFTALSVQASGKTGATATPITLAGGTASGAPSTGAHIKGEIAFDDAGVGYYCTVAGTPGTWVQINSSVFVAQSLVDAKGDLLVGSADNTVIRKAVGSDGQVLTADAASTGGVKWAAASGSVAADAIFDAKGDLPVGTGADTAAKLTVGANDSILTADSAQSTGLKYITRATLAADTAFSSVYAPLAFKGCRAYRSAALNMTDNTVSTIGLDAESHDTIGMHDNATNNTRLTVPTGYAGYWRLTAQVSYSGNGTGVRGARVHMNGSAISAMNLPPHAAGSNGTGSTVTVTVLAGVGDYFELGGFQNSGGSLAVATGAVATYLEAQFVGT